jgi:hypothetical protein
MGIDQYIGDLQLVPEPHFHRILWQLSCYNISTQNFMMSFNLDAARICKYGEEFPLHLDCVEAMFLKSRHRLSSGTKKWGGPKGASAFGNFELLEKVRRTVGVFHNQLPLIITACLRW